jgi:hypothetical protein
LVIPTKRLFPDGSNGYQGIRVMVAVLRRPHHTFDHDLFAQAAVQHGQDLPRGIDNHQLVLLFCRQYPHLLGFVTGSNAFVVWAAGKNFQAQGASQADGSFA